MGLFDRKKTISTSEQTFITENRGIQDVQDSTVIAGDADKIYIQQSDANAIAAGENIALAGIYAGQAGLEEAADLARTSLYSGADLARSGFSEGADLARTSLFEAGDLSRRALDVGDRASSRAFTLFERVIDNVQQSGRDFVESIGAVQQRESVNTDARLEQITRIALIGAGLIVAVSIWRA